LDLWGYVWAIFLEWALFIQQRVILPI
jgi:hypothetical protein